MKDEVRDRYCGNCDGHNCYEYPSKIFCSIRYEQDLDPIVETLWCCEFWTEVNQECYCIREALKAKETPKNSSIK